MRRSLVLVSALTLIACSSTGPSGGDTAPTTAPPDTAIASTTAATTAPPTTTPSNGWEPAAPSSDGAPVAPCCGADWEGVPSPALPTEGGPLLDGAYVVGVEWPDTLSLPITLHLRVYRLEYCNLIADRPCNDPESTTALGVDRSYSVPLELLLDSNVTVNLLGYLGPGPAANVGARATGAELAELAVAVDSAFATVFAARLGEDPNAVIADVIANPVGGFSGADDGSDYSIVFSHRDAPGLLFQTVQLEGRGTDVLRVETLVVRDGKVTLNIYAGWAS